MHNKAKQLSNYEIQFVLNEKYYKCHFNIINNLKSVLSEAHKLQDKNSNIRVKNKCIEIRKTVKKQLIELENKSQKSNKKLFDKEKRIRFFKIINICKSISSKVLIFIQNE